VYSLRFGLGSVAVGSACSTYSAKTNIKQPVVGCLHLSSWWCRCVTRVTLTGSDNGCYYKLPEGLFSLASDGANDDLLPKAFRVTHFFYVGSIPRVF